MQEAAARAAARSAAKAVKRGRATQRQAHLAAAHGVTDPVALAAAMAAAVRRDNAARTARARAARPRRGRPGPRDVADSNVNRWVPIGPSVVRRGQADNRPHVSGRIRDIAIDATGRRAYAGSGKAGVWYTEDAGITWRPLGGHATTPGLAGGINTDLCCGTLLVQFGADASEDYVMVGTGERVGVDPATRTNPTHFNFGGRGVLAGQAPVNTAEDQSPFEPLTGINEFENTVVHRLARDPARRTTALAGALDDRVVAAAENGLFLGTRVDNAGELAWEWTLIAGATTTETLADGTVVDVPVTACDVQWVPIDGNPDGRLYVAVSREGVMWSDQLGAAGSWNWVGGLNRRTDNILVSGPHCLSDLVNDRIYVLHGRDLATKVDGRDDAAFLNRIPNATRTQANGGPGASQRVPGVPDALWGTQLTWDQAICADRIGTTDRVWVGGSAITPFSGADWSASLYCYDVQETGTGAPRLVPAAGVSRRAAPPAGEGASQSALAGNGVHADVHVVRSVAMDDGTRHVWVGCDGGVYVSERNGRVNTFQSRVTGLSVLEAGFVAVHPTSSQYCALGAQDNGSQVRTGDTVWEEVQLGDGGGLMFHPTASQYLVTQYVRGTWKAMSPTGFVDPLTRTPGGGDASEDREGKLALFYSGCDAVEAPGGVGRLAIGSNRVWISDDLGTTTPNTWSVIDHNAAAATAASDPRAGGADPSPALGVPVPDVGPVVTLRWASPTRLYAVYREAVFRYDQAVDGTWTTTPVLVAGDTPDPTTMRVSDLAPIPGSTDFYFTTLGDLTLPPAVPMETCWVRIGNTNTATKLREELVPNDPALSVCLDPGNPLRVFVGTLGGLWVGNRTVSDTGEVDYGWETFMNGLPVTCVSDVRAWRTPGVPADEIAPLTLLRAATQSRGVWEVDLTAEEPSRTWLRVHATDDRRVLPTPMTDPRVAPTARLHEAYASPDVIIRPAPRASALPALRFPFLDHQVIGRQENGSVHLWEFQTAFRWLVPSIRADGQWSEQLAHLIEMHRMASGLGRGRDVNKATWDNVVGGTHLTADRVVSRVPADHWAVYETPWQLAGAADTLATEVDTVELVRPQRERDSIWQVHAGACRVDVTLHHRDTRAVPANGAYTALFTKSAPSKDALLAELAENFSGLYGWTGGATVPTPAGWTRVLANGSAVHRLAAPLDAYLPRAVSIDLDLSAEVAGTHVLLFAVCGSSAETPPVPDGMVDGVSTVVDLVRAWPRAAMRLVQVTDPRRVVT